MSTPKPELKERTKQLVSAEEVKAVSNTLKIKYGIDFTNYEMSSLTRGLNRVLVKHRMSNTLELWSRLLRDREFLVTFIDGMTVNLTELFRNPDFWQEIMDLLQNLYQYKSVKIWHAGCSTGEEVYTMAILLAECGMTLRSELVGSDLSSRVLEMAEKGVYTNYAKKYKESLKKTFDHINIDNYFIEDEKDFQVKPTLKKNIKWVPNNLVTDKSLGTFDVIFCRNVMIYFDDKLKLQVMEKFYNSLADDGYFIIGYYDMMPAGADQFFENFNPRCRIYKKRVKS
jgi:chemotaxis protein methyltransferase CheR